VELTRIKPILTAGALLAVLFGIGTLMDHHGAAQAADGGPTVTIGAPLPVPISGSVAINGTPGVNVNNTPNVHIVNTSSSPALTSSLDDPGRHPYQATVSRPSCQATSGGENCGFLFPLIPLNRRLVVEHVSGIFSFTAVPTILYAGVGSPVAANFFPIPQATVAPPGALTSFDQATKLYFDTTTLSPLVSLAFLGTANLQGGSVTLTGYLLDCAAAPCAPIAP